MEISSLTIENENYLVIKQQDFETLLSEGQDTNNELFKKKEYCCTTFYNQQQIDKHQYKEYPVLAEGVCLRHMYKDNGNKFVLSKGKC